MAYSRRCVVKAIALATAAPLGSFAVGALAESQFPAGDLRHYGVVPNDPSKASSNTTALKALCSPEVNASGFTGKLFSPNTTGKDIYYFDDIITFRDDIHLDLQGTTWHFSKIGVAKDTNSGFIFAIRNFSVENGSIVVDYQMGGGGLSAGSAIAFGNRADHSAYFSPTFDSKLSAPMGNVAIRNIKITSNTAGGNGIFMIGGLNGVEMENVSIDGQGALAVGIYYEFGWATDEAQPSARQTSHAHRMKLKNIRVENLELVKWGIGIGLTGAYDCTIDGLTVRSARSALDITPGESLFYRPWTGVDNRGGRKKITALNVVGSELHGTGVAVTGAERNTGYLHPLKLTPEQQTDLLDVLLDGFTLRGSPASFGVSTSAGNMEIENGHIFGFQRGIVTTNECTRFKFDNVEVRDSTSIGIQLGIGANIFTPPRKKSGVIRNCFIAGSGVAGPSEAIWISQADGVLIENNRFGYEQGREGKLETTQTQAVNVDGTCANVVCRDNSVAGVAGGAVAYNLSGAAAGHGCAIESAKGIATSSGPWQGAVRR